MLSAKKFRVHVFGTGDPLADLPQTSQVQYLRCYLEDLGAEAVIEEPHYFDRDYLAEFGAFYSTSATGYLNVCRRLHFFGVPCSRQQFIHALRGGNRLLKRLKDAYLGFAVLRPIPGAPLGRTVLRWYPESRPSNPRMMAPSRTYLAHVAGIPFEVEGLAWQQQDTGVGACATVALWSMLHASAFDEHHAIPTTASITRSAHKTAALGARVFPSSGLSLFQVLEAIKETGLAPLIVEGDTEAAFPFTGSTAPMRGFTRGRFGASCGTLIRSGYTALLVGKGVGLGAHAICAVGFRPGSGAPVARSGEVALDDGNIELVYVHDDNIGPGMRCRVVEPKPGGPVVLYPEPPKTNSHLRTTPNPCANYHPFVPATLVAAVHNEVRLSSDTLSRHALSVSVLLSKLLTLRSGGTSPGLTVGTRFVRLRDYLGEELSSPLSGNARALGKARVELCERVRPMSLHLGLIRIAVGGTPIADVLVDTTDSKSNMAAFAFVSFNQDISRCVRSLQSSAPAALVDRGLGVLVEAH